MKCQLSKIFKKYYINNVGLADTAIFVNILVENCNFVEMNLAVWWGILSNNIYMRIPSSVILEQTLYPILAEEDKRIKIDSLDRIDTHFFLKFWPLITHMFDDFM